MIQHTHKLCKRTNNDFNAKIQVSILSFLWLYAPPRLLFRNSLLSFTRNRRCADRSTHLGDQWSKNQWQNATCTDCFNMQRIVIFTWSSWYRNFVGISPRIILPKMVSPPGRAHCAFSTSEAMLADDALFTACETSPCAALSHRASCTGYIASSFFCCKASRSQYGQFCVNFNISWSIFPARIFCTKYLTKFVGVKVLLDKKLISQLFKVSSSCRSKGKNSQWSNVCKLSVIR